MFPTTTKYAIGIPILLVLMLLSGIDTSWSERNLFRSTDDRRRNPPLYPRQWLVDHREDSSKFSKHNKRLPLRESDTFSKNIVVEKGARSPFRARMHRNYNKNENTITANERETSDKEKRIHQNSSTNRRNSKTMMTQNDEIPQNGTRPSLMSKENKRDISKGKAASRFNRLYRSLARFDLLYLLGWLMIFIPVASAAVIVLPIVSFCRSACTRGPKRKSSVVGPDSKDVVLLESVAVADDESARATKPADLYKDVFKNLVSNEIDGEGDTVAKRMKLERRMMQNAEHRPRRSFNRSRHFNSTQMEKVEEEEDSAEEDSAEEAEEAFWSESEGPPEDNPEFPERFRQKGDKGAHKQESGPFAFAVERMHHPRYGPNPRHIYSVVNHSGRVPGRTCYSMLDINTARYSRL